MVYEDALTILCYASPYEVEVEAKTVPKGHHGPPGSGGQGAQPKHPLFRSSSSSDLVKVKIFHSLPNTQDSYFIFIQ